MKIRAVYRSCVFDFDGTIIDTMKNFTETAARVMKRYFAIPLSEGRRLYIETSGLPFHLQLEEIFPGNPENRMAAAEFECNKMKEISAENFFPEVKGVIEELRGAGVLTAVSSNNFPENVKRLLNEAGIEVDMILGYAPGFHKGDPHFSAIEKEWDIGPADILYVGDSLKDAAWAKEHGVEFIARAGTVSEERFRREFPEYRVVHDLTPLPEIIIGREKEPE